MRYLTLLLSLVLTIGQAKDIDGEQIVSDPNVFFGYTQLAPMLQNPDSSVSIFRNAWGVLRILHLWPDRSHEETMETVKGYRVPYHIRDGRPNSGEFANYSSVRTSAGIWLIGATIELLRPDGTRLSGSLIKQRIEPGVVALRDGSILVVGSKEWHATIPETYDSDGPGQRTVERVSLNAEGRIVSEVVAPVPSCRPANCLWESVEGFALIDIGGGRVMLAGGYGSSVTYIYDSATRNWRMSSHMSEERTDFSLTLLPDGRVLAAGGNNGIRDHSNNGMTTEIWDPRTELWSRGPRLPMPIKEQQALLVNNKTVILAGGRFAGVLAWDIDQPQWRVAATLADARSLAGVAWLGNGRLAIIGGLHANTYEEAYGKRTEGYSVFDIGDDVTRPGKPAGLATEAFARATRGTLTLVAGGMVTSTFDGSVNKQPTSNVELYDSSTNTVRSLPPLPFGAKAAKAYWLDDSRVLIMALENDGYHSPLWADLLDIKSGNHKTIRLPAKIGGFSMQSKEFLADLKVAGIHEDRATIIFESQRYLASLDFVNGKFLPGIRIHRSGFKSRVSSNGEIVIAGGTGAQLMFSRVANCDSCPGAAVEYGDMLPASTYEIVDPARKKTITSAQSSAFGGPVAILGDGRVAKLGVTLELAKYVNDQSSPIKKSLLLELSDTAGTTWHSLNLPPPLRSEGDIGGARLESVNDPKGVLGGVLLCGIADVKGGRHWWWIDLDRSAAGWQRLGTTQPDSAASPSKANPGRLSIGGRTYSLVEEGDGIAAFPQNTVK